MADTTAPTSSAELQETFDRTEFGHWIYQNRKPFMAAVILVFIGASGLLVYRQMHKAKINETSAQVYEFDKKVMEGFRKSTVNNADFTKAFSSLDKDVKSSPAMLPVALEASKLLEERGDVAAGTSVLKDVLDGVGPKSALSMLLAFNYAAMAEKNGQVDEAIKTYEGYVASGQKVMLPKAYVELGRLYLAKGDQAKAKTQFDYVVSKYPNDDTAKLAKLYLGNMQ